MVHVAFFIVIQVLLFAIMLPHLTNNQSCNMRISIVTQLLWLLTLYILYVYIEHCNCMVVNHA